MRIQSTDTLSARFTSEDFFKLIGLRARGRVFFTRSTHSDRLIVVDVHSRGADSYIQDVSFGDAYTMTQTLPERVDVFTYGDWTAVTTAEGTYAQFA